MVSGPVTAFAPAKINLYLHVTGRRADGYHLLDSLVAFAGIQDSLTALPWDRLGLTIDGPFGAGLTAGPDNLVLRAATRLAEEAGVPARARLALTKRLPVASGIGGGSADAAAALRALNRLWDLKAADDDLLDLALELGADVPVCLLGRAAFMGGIGEILIPAPALPEASLLLVNPGVSVPTPAVFKARNGDFSKESRFTYAPTDAAELAALLKARGNDLTTAAESLQPAIGKVLRALAPCPGLLLARMSGSGATCFGLFDSPASAVQAALSIGQHNPGWWVKPASLEQDGNRLERERQTLRTA
ncbi:MAG: 4-(cytidine 5'-diphospho)-2-C-methyl-D-erythritol kinase [Rhodobacterales bacterium]|nr:4-(cytidine 5'-diphospho)-2-C-methyl-D-erythritol kinase [Rhodobacterales bacterium]